MSRIIEQMAVSRLDCKFEEVNDNDGKMSFSGYGAVFGNVDSYGDVIAPGAFAKSLATHYSEGSQPLMFLNHDAFGSLPIGRWTEMSEDGHGLKVHGELLDTQMGKDTYTALKAGAINGLSIGFRPIEFATRSKPDEPRRTLKAIDLIEVSVVTIPANQKARVQAVKSFGEQMTVRDLEMLLKECGLSRGESTAVAAQFESKLELEEAKALNDNIESLIAKFRAA
ncbi:HK97 family phage prohead protease [Microvirga sp. SRT01]|uniref:HK97 family phage prohead protease n=1 Tax=Sphingomonas longa TaxID=2778730 RepID=A0ABS2D893_9SPHN|nr:HK97 family phage prohead protease [Microvirga sp. SRT01]MBM6577123.1 HK97 family phage prohead protease [Sphingomonas sp. BT552]MBR7710167.1 HK97 family phage prohead protease [Microvirga sp. SRT01]